MAGVLTWATFQEEFEWDGALVEVYVLNTDLGDWQALLRFLSESGLPLAYSVDHEPAVLTDDLAAIFAVRDDASPLLTVDPGGLTLNCHFFTPDEIELNLDPRDATGYDWVSRLTSLLTGLARVLGKPVLLCAENMPDRPRFIIMGDGVTRS